MNELIFLNLGSNVIQGTIPDSVWDLRKLWFLDLSHTNLDPFNLPDSIENLSNLELLFLWQTSMIGNLPETIGSLTRLKIFSVALNELTGTLPNSIGNWMDLTELDVHSNKLYGTIPQSISSWTNIQKAHFQDNDFTGTIPSEICSVESRDIVVECSKIVGCQCCNCAEQF
jgi:hypothetical protein